MKKHQYKYDLIFNRKIRDGFSPGQVMQQLKTELKLEDVQVNSLFDGDDCLFVCENEDYDTVLAIHKKFFSIGIDLKLKVRNNRAPGSGHVAVNLLEREHTGRI